MKKLFYITLTVVILLVIGYVVKQRFATPELEVIVEEEVAITMSDSTEETTDEVIAEEVVETNPEETADEGETFVEE